MAMFPCPDCKKPISLNADHCPKCGRTIKPEDIKKWKEKSEKSKKKGKKFGIILGLFLITITIISVFNSNTNNKKTSSIDQIIENIESMMSDFKNIDIYVSSEDDHIICVDVTIDGTANGIAALKLVGPSGDWSSWDKLTTSAANLCKTIKQNVDDMGHDEIHVMYSIKNDKNKGNIFYSSLDGSEIYNTKND